MAHDARGAEHLLGGDARVGRGARERADGLVGLAQRRHVGVGHRDAVRAAHVEDEAEVQPGRRRALARAEARRAAEQQQGGEGGERAVGGGGLQLVDPVAAAQQAVQQPHPRGAGPRAATPSSTPSAAQSVSSVLMPEPYGRSPMLRA